MNKHVLSSLVLGFLMSVGIAFTSTAFAQSADNVPTMTKEELATFDGQNGNKAYFAYEGLVYDVTSSKLWKAGEHFGLKAGEDLTGKLDGAPHGTESFKGFPIVAQLEGSVTTPVTTEVKTPTTNQEVAATTTQTPTDSPKWYEGRIRIAGFSILGWTGILLGVFFVLNFATCFALPWTKLPLPWKGARPGTDALDGAENRLRWGSVHKYFAWLAVIFGILHGIIGFMQMMGFYL